MARYDYFANFCSGEKPKTEKPYDITESTSLKMNRSKIKERVWK